MRIPLTKYGLPQLIFFPAMLIAIMSLCPFFALSTTALIILELPLAVILIWILSFFRDPKRDIPINSKLLLAPADGKITDIETIQENSPLDRPALRIGIFLSIFNVHINRAPCNVKIEKISYKKGSFKNAANPNAGQVNESNDLLMLRTENPNQKILVRQISGAIARRIVCKAAPGQNLTGGQKFGMIKFGSRTELYVPASKNFETLVKKGDKVKAGLTPLIKYR